MTVSRLRSHLRKTDADLDHRFHGVELELRKLLEYSQAGVHMMFTPHGLSHISRLEASYDWLLSPEDVKSFNAAEVFVLLVATLSHDLLMIPRRSGDEAQARETHAQAVDAFLQEASGLPITAPEARAVGKVVRGHHVAKLDEIPHEVVLGSDLVDLRKLAACLSLADICDADERRAPRIVFDYLSLNEASTWHWMRHLQISGITRRNHELLMSAFCYSDEGQAAVELYKRAIETQLELVRPYFASCLSPLSSVRLMLERQRSAIDTPIAFSADVPALINLLIEGVYERDDAFVRELIQNALDATYLAHAQALQSATAYEPRIVLTALRDPDGKVSGIRVDDNGFGMSIRDVRATLLTIASTQATSKHVVDLLATSGKNLIATFGIGLLSCLKVTDIVQIATQRAGEQAVSVEVTAVGDEIRPIAAPPDGPGTTVVLRLAEESRESFNPRASCKHYCRQIVQASLYYGETSDESSFVERSREELLTLAGEGEFEVIEPLDARGLKYACDISGPNHWGTLWLREAASTDAIRRLMPGQLLLLNDGIFIATAPADEWLPRELALFDGVVNFQAGTVNLSASRDTVRRDSTFVARREEVATLARRVVGTLAAATSQRSAFTAAARGAQLSIAREEIDTAVLALCAMQQHLANEAVSAGWFHDLLGSYTVNAFAGTQISLDGLVAEAPDEVYLGYGAGNTVERLCEFNGHGLYYDPGQSVVLEATLLMRAGHRVIWADNLPVTPLLNEKEMLEGYLLHRGKEVFDVIDTHPMKRGVRARGLHPRVRDALGDDVKFVDLGVFASRLGWRVGDETWLNLGNSRIESVYRRLSGEHASTEVLQKAVLLAMLIGEHFDDAVDELFRQVKDSP